MPRSRKYQEMQRRAAYPPDVKRKNAYQPREEEWVAYPDSVYEEETQAEAQPFYYAAQGGWAAGGAPRKRKNTALWAFVALICLALLGLMGYGTYEMYAAYMPFRQKVAITEQKTFAQGVLVDGVHIGGMNFEQAEAALKREDASGVSGLHLSLNVDGYTWVITPNELPFERNIHSVLDTAYAIGRLGSAYKSFRRSRNQDPVPEYLD